MVGEERDGKISKLACERKRVKREGREGEGKGIRGPKRDKNHWMEEIINVRMKERRLEN